MARPKINIDGELVEKMASWGCKTVEIADWFKCDPDTITGRFSEELRKGRGSLRTNLRQWQLATARGGNATLLIWLGKQLLDQKDEPQTVVNNNLAIGDDAKVELQVRIDQIQGGKKK